MVHSSGKIPGFSGTDFKHRKGFEKIKAVHDKESRIGNSTNEGWKRPKTNLKIKFFKITVLLFLISSLTFVFSALVIQQNSKLRAYGANHNLAVEAQVKQTESKKSENAFGILMNSAIGLLAQNYFDDAQREAVLALKIKPYDPKANLIMTEILVKKCQFLQSNCDDALAYLAALSHLKGIDKKEVFRLKQIIEFQPK